MAVDGRDGLRRCRKTVPQFTCYEQHAKAHTTPHAARISVRTTSPFQVALLISSMGKDRLGVLFGRPSRQDSLCIIIASFSCVERLEPRQLSLVTDEVGCSDSATGMCRRPKNLTSRDGSSSVNRNSTPWSPWRGKMDRAAGEEVDVMKQDSLPTFARVSDRRQFPPVGRGD